MWNFIGYKCTVCGSEYTENEVTYTCPKDDGNLDVVMDLKADVFSVEPSMWRYLPLLPVSDPGCTGTPFRRVGMTPLYGPYLISQDNSGNVMLTRPEAGRMEGKKTGIWIKDEAVNPTASFKDRASALVLARAREIGNPVVVTASTGNAGAALAGMAAASGQQAVIFTPKSAPAAKLAQMKAYGAVLILVDGNYDSAGALALEAAEEFGWYCRNTGYNPFTLEGKKTAGFEIWDAINTGDLPHSSEEPVTIVVPVGDGNIISGVHKGLKDLMELGVLERSPVIYGVQAEGSAAIARSWEAGKDDVEAVQSKTIADSISVDMPADGIRALRAVRQTGGRYVQVSDEEIVDAIRQLGSLGIFSEPAAASAFAGYRKAVKGGHIKPETAVLLVNTGSGLKDAAAVDNLESNSIIVEPNLQSLQRALEKKNLMERKL